jgi:hypothetical protein
LRGIAVFCSQETNPQQLAKTPIALDCSEANTSVRDKNTKVRLAEEPCCLQLEHYVPCFSTFQAAFFEILLFDDIKR